MNYDLNPSITEQLKFIQIPSNAKLFPIQLKRPDNAIGKK